ncbi:MAG: ABC transporter permease subunit, partial [Planctomycetota bacterium]
WFACCANIAFVILIVYSMLNLGDEVLKFVASIDFIRKIFEVSLGIQVEGDVSINMLFAVAFTHGMILTITWGTIIATSTRVTVGEIEQGTVDLLMSLPVTRFQIFASFSLAILVITIALSCCPIAGVAIGNLVFETDEAIEISRYIVPTINFIAVNLAIGGISTMVGCILNRRANVVGIVVGVAFVSVVLNFVEPFLPNMMGMQYLGLLSYYRPADIVRTGEWPVLSMFILTCVAIMTTSVAALVFCRKDIPAV